MKFLLQCPCSGGSAIHPVLLLAIVAAIWLLARWIKSVFRKEGDSLMNKFGKIAIVAVLIAAVVVVIAVKQRDKTDVGSNLSQNPSAVVTAADSNASVQDVGQPKVLPRLLDLGADQCIPCKMMAPILEELKKEYVGRLVVEFVDVWKNSAEAERYGIKLIPTQIFFDASGKERFRHEGFISKEDILGKWKELGIELEKGTNNETN
ncbi:MAG: thioredoxin domain-containing protein [Dehalococcoidia bacterium]|nr:thioredoxin domain-containing protein [Dehalococcoidia bacterium]